MIEEINIGCASTNTSYGRRLDTTLVELNSKANMSALFTSNKFKSAPVQVCLNHIKTKKKGRKILAINAGNANAATGKKGVSDTKKLVKEISKLSGVPISNILPFSTGVVGQLLNMKSLSLAFNECFKNLNKNSWSDFATSIMTTDTKSKIIKLSVKIGSKKYHIVGVAKGVGMIEPNMATTLSYVFTDLKISESILKKMHKRICDKTFNAVSIDGDQSPSDSSVLVATGTSEIDAKKNITKIEKDIFLVFQKLSEKLVLDGEGSTKLLNITVKGLSSELNCKKIAMKIANSPLVKTAAFGEDPNWGRIVVAAGNADVQEFDIEKLSLKIGKHPVLVNGNLSKKYKENQGQKEFKKRKINLELSIGKSKKSFTVIGSDLTKEYISINSDYRS
ncbi:bifunctional glutamate N-acetyltransferase/amino-acid acetyltransferase ArgJ [SAR86 cluster bacterium]|nr:bifunctional glutamate N-acetyltransferase/amino-acid acetyltransferase ArgJ [SAR86 cluster bacterium]